MILFVYSVVVRAPHLDELNTGNHQFLTGSTIQFAKNWLKEGPANLKFMMVREFRGSYSDSLDFRRRDWKVSFLPGSIAPIYLLGLANGEITPLLVNSFNLSLHLITCLLIFFLVWKLFFSVWPNSRYSATVAVVSALSFLLLPGNMFYLSKVYYHPNLPLPLCVLYLLLTIGKEPEERKRAPHIALKIFILTFGLLADWFFVFVCFFNFVASVLENRRKLIRALLESIILPCILPASLLIYHMTALPISRIVSIDGEFQPLTPLQELLYRFTNRTGDTGANLDLLKRFWTEVVPVNTFDGAAYFIAFVLVGILFILSRRSLRNLFFGLPSRGLRVSIGQSFLRVGLVVLGSSLLQAFLLRNYVNHDFGYLNIGLSISVFCLPLFFYIFKVAISKWLGEIWFRTGGVVVILILSGIIAQAHSRFPKLFPPNDPQMAILTDEIREYSSYKDIVFSTNLSFELTPPQWHSLAEKQVHRIDSLWDIENFLVHLNQLYDVLLVMPQMSVINRPGIAHLLENTHFFYQGPRSGWYFFRLENIHYNTELPRAWEKVKKFIDDLTDKGRNPFQMLEVWKRYSHQKGLNKTILKTSLQRLANQTETLLQSLFEAKKGRDRSVSNVSIANPTVIDRFLVNLTDLGNQEIRIYTAIKLKTPMPPECEIKIRLQSFRVRNDWSYGVRYEANNFKPGEWLIFYRDVPSLNFRKPDTDFTLVCEGKDFASASFVGDFWKQ